MRTLPIPALLKWIWQGKTLTRAMLNPRLAAESHLTGILISWQLPRFPIFVSRMVLERLYGRLKPGVSPKRYPLAYFVVAAK